MNIPETTFDRNVPGYFRKTTVIEKFRYWLAYHMISTGYDVHDGAFEEVASEAEYSYCPDCQGRQ